MARPTEYPIKKLIRLDEETFQQVKKFASDEDLTFTEAIRLLLKDHLTGLGYSND
jgi:antitoxin component of RelBE/YafQ-DinJ toxin-antitoxin module